MDRLPEILWTSFWPMFGDRVWISLFGCLCGLTHTYIHLRSSEYIMSLRAIYRYVLSPNTKGHTTLYRFWMVWGGVFIHIAGWSWTVSRKTQQETPHVRNPVESTRNHSSNLGGNYHHFWWYWLNHVLYLGVAMFCHLVTGGFSRSYLGLAQQLVQRATATWSRHAVRLPTQVRPTGGKGQKNLVINGGTDHWNKLGYCRYSMFCDFVSFIQ